MLSHFEHILTIVFFIILIKNISLETVDEPLAVIDHARNVKLALPADTSNYEEFYIDYGEKLVCLCPPENNANQPLIPLSKDEQSCWTPCSKKLIPFVIPDTSAVCANGGYFTTIGYKIDLGGPITISTIPFVSPLLNWLYRKLQHIHLMQIVDFCRTEDDQVLYAMHTLLAYPHPKINYDDMPSYATQFGDYNDEQNILSEYYSEENQRKSLDKIFGDNYKTYFSWPSAISNKKRVFQYFVLEQLIKSDDMVLSTWRITTYYSMNTAAMWISVSEGSWKRANQYIRLLAYKLHFEFLIFSGTYGQLTISNRTIDLYDSNQNSKITVPLIFWKVLYYGPYNTGLAIIVYNDIGSPLNSNFCSITSCPKLKEFRLENAINKINGFAFCCKLDASLLQKLHLAELFSQSTDIVALDSKVVNEDGQLNVASREFDESTDHFKDWATELKNRMKKQV